MDLFKGKSRQQSITENNMQSMYNTNRPSEVNTDGVISKSKDSYSFLNKKAQGITTKKEDKEVK